MSTKKKPVDLKSVDPQVLSEYKEVFSGFDRDGDGTIDAGELSAVLGSFGVTPSVAELTQMVADVDLDQSGAIDFAEFVTMMLSRSNTSNPEDEAESVFYALDKNKDGYVGFDDLKQTLQTSVKWANEPAPNDSDIMAMLNVRGATPGKGLDLAAFKKIVLGTKS
jgi:Ca2+-binding EF-hand superfamily protein